uniref:Reverse transcriptase Ty1/copia-type domain-containing protein n=1 Tax=Arundo donax TaxID=35708 RepID=A0A0A9ENB8_ARUDO
MLSAEEPASFVEANQEEAWRKAMEEEMEAVEENKTWRLVELPLGHRPIGLRWVYKLKKDAGGNVVRHKARLVAKGYVQRAGVDFDEVFAPVARLESVRLMIAIAVHAYWELQHLDISSAFLNDDLHEEVYVE